MKLYRVGVCHPGEKEQWTGGEYHIFRAKSKRDAVGKFRCLYRRKKKHYAVEGEIIIAERIPGSQVFD